MLGIVFDTCDDYGLSQRVGWVSFSIPIRDSRGNGAELRSLMGILGFPRDTTLVLCEGLLGSAGYRFRYPSVLTAINGC